MEDHSRDLALLNSERRNQETLYRRGDVPDTCARFGKVEGRVSRHDTSSVGRGSGLRVGLIFLAGWVQSLVYVRSRACSPVCN